MKKQFILFLSIVSLAFIGCNDDVDNPATNFVSFEAESYNFGVDVGGSSTNEINVFSGKTTSSDRAFTIEVVEDGTTADATSYTVPSTFTIPANENSGSFSVTISDVSIDDGKTLILAIKNEEGLFTGENITLNVNQVCPSNEVILDIVFDGYASETSLSLTDADGTVIFSIATGDWADGLETYTKNLCLDNGTYDFVINDSYGDGLSYPSDGSVELTNNGTSLYSVSGNFGTSASGSFTVGQ